MRQIHKKFPLLLAAALLAGCENPMSDVAAIDSPTVFTATIESDMATKTMLGAPDESGVRPVEWVIGDAINVGGAVYESKDNGSQAWGPAVISFYGTGAQKVGNLFKAYYPKEIYNGGTPALLQTQTCVMDDETVRIDHLPMYAQSLSGDLKFVNLCGILELKLTGDKTVGFIEVESLDNKQLWGPFTVDYNTGNGTTHPTTTLTMIGTPAENYTKVKLDCSGGVSGGGVALHATEPKTFYIAIPPANYAAGKLKITVKEPSGTTITTFPSKTDFTVKRKKIYEIAKGTDGSNYTLVHTGTTVTLSDGTVVQEVFRLTGDAGNTDAVTFDSYLTRDGSTTKEPVSISGTYEYVAADDDGLPTKENGGTVAWTTTRPAELNGVIIDGEGVDKTFKASVKQNTNPNYKGRVNVTAYHAAALQRNGENGFTQSSPQDLSLYDITSMTSPRASGKPVTANCYVVDRAGWYMFPVVYGNAIDCTRASESEYNNGVNTIAYKDFARNYSEGGNISSPYVLDDTGMSIGDCEAVILWEDVPSAEYAFVENVSLNAVSVSSGSFYDPVGGSWKTSVPYIKFKVPTTKLYDSGGAETSDPSKAVVVKGARQGNALIALRKKSDQTILWSWHIWVTDGYDVDGDKLGDGLDPIPVTLWGGVRISNLMPVNLGYCETDDNIRYADRVWFVRIRQDVGSADPIVFKVIQRVPSPPKYNSGTFYQWGRKDPFLPYARNDQGLVRIKSSFSPAGITTFQYTRHSSSGISYAITHPTHFMQYYVQSGLDIYSWQKPSDRNQSLWKRNYPSVISGTSKTVYDPCPPGYCVPRENIWSGFLGTNEWGKYPLLNQTTPVHVVDMDGSGDITLDDFWDGVTFYTNSAQTGTIHFPRSGSLGYNTGELTAQIWVYITASIPNNYFPGYQNECLKVEIDPYASVPAYILANGYAGEYNATAMPVRPTREELP